MIKYLASLIVGWASPVIAVVFSAVGVVQAGELNAGAKVRLLFPILTGNELDQILPLAPQGVIVDFNGSPFVEVGRFADARVAHRLGVSIQRRISIPFDLAYDQGHPQLALAQIGQLIPGVPPLDIVPAMAGSIPPMASSIKQPVERSFDSPENVANRAATASSPYRNNDSQELVNSGQLITAESKGFVQVFQDIFTPIPLAAGSDHAPSADVGVETSLPKGQQDLSKAQLSTEPTPHPSRGLNSTPAELSEVLRQVIHPSPLAHTWADPTETLASPEVEQVETRSVGLGVRSGSRLPEDRHPWMRPVPIAAVDVGVPITRLQPATNPSLNYLYVQLQQPSDLARLQQLSPVQELAVQGDVLLARVGVFTASRQGHVLLNERMARLRTERLELRLARAGGLGMDSGA